MNFMDKDMEYILEQAKNLLAIDSPSGYTKKVVEYLLQEYERLGYEPVLTKKGGVLVDLGGVGDGILVTAHVDTLGGMTAEIKENGRLRITPVGGLNPNNIEAENCRIYTYEGRVYTGTVQLINASIHVNREYGKTKRNFDTIEVVLDEPVSCQEEVQALGIMTGNYVCMEPRTVLTETGYLKSRFLDDKLSTAILLGYARYLKMENRTPARRIYHHVTVFEEVGHGGAGSVPGDVTDILSVDMGCVGNGLSCTEHQVSICVKDSRGPYHYEIVSELIRKAKEQGIDFAADVYPSYGSDADAALAAGHDLRHGLIGPGVYASHGYERSHVDGIRNTFLLLKAFPGEK